MKIPIQINNLTARFDPKITDNFIVDCDDENVYMQEQGSDVKYPMSFESFNKFYLSESNLKLGHGIKND